MARTRPVHPAAEIFPMMDEASLRELTSDIDTNGLQEPVVYFQGKLIDGRNRLAACNRLGIEPDEFELDSDTDPVAYVLSANLHRRHLTTSQQSMVAARVKSLYAEKAKERQKEAGKQHGRGKEKVPENLREANGDKHASESSSQAGAAVGVSGRSVDHATTVIEKGSKELQKAVDAGEIAVSKAAAIAKSVPKKDQLEVAKSKPVKPPKDYPLSDQYIDIVGKFGTAIVQINEDFGGISALLADKRWDKKETAFFKQQIALLHRSLGNLKKELENV